MLSSRDYQLKKAELRLRMELQRQDMGDCIRDVKAVVNPWITALRSFRSGLSLIGPVATAAGLAIPFVSRFFGKKKEVFQAPASKSSKLATALGYIFPAAKIALRFLVK